MNVLFAAAEAVPFVKVGGLADVAGALPKALRALGHDVRVVVPRYRQSPPTLIDPGGPRDAMLLPVGDRMELMRVYTARVGGTPVYLLDIPSAFDRAGIFGEHDDDWRYILFSRGVLALLLYLRERERWVPEVLHANDWHTGLLPNYFKQAYAHLFGPIATVYTIHNLGYQGFFTPFSLHLAGLDGGGEQYLNFMARGIRFADIISTVSPTYAAEILTPEYGANLDALLRTRQEHLAGILNGIDYDLFDPASDPQIAAHYSADNPAGKAACKAALQHELGFAADPTRPLLGMINRLVNQKGLDLLLAALPWLLGSSDAQLVVLGSGDPAIEQALAEHARAAPERMVLRLGFDGALAQRIYAGSDAFLMPSQYEPCGLGQLIALRYGSIPVVRATGGLADTVREGYEGNGFRFHGYSSGDLIDALVRCLTCFRAQDSWGTLRARGMREDHSWGDSARQYAALYEWAARVV